MPLEIRKIRKLLVDELKAVRAELVALEAALDDAIGPDAQVRPGLHEQIEHVFMSLRRHALHELELLEPVIRDIDAWGPVRAAEMDDEREELRALFAHYSRLDAKEDPRRWAEEVKKLAVHLREELDAEEKGRLSAEVLKDDVIVVDFGG